MFCHIKNKIIMPIGLMLIFLWCLTGCATAIPFNTVSIGGDPLKPTTRKAFIKYSTGTIQGLIHFSEQDHKELINVFKSELLRLNLFSSVINDKPSEFTKTKITVNFKKSTHVLENHKYILEFELVIEGGKEAFQKEYKVISSNGDSIWDTVTTNVYEAKLKAVRGFLEVVIPDVKNYIALYDL